MVSHDFSRVSFQEIDAEREGQRLDNFLFQLLKTVPKSKVYNIIRRGEVRLNGKRVTAKQRLHAGDKLRLPPLRFEPADPSAKPAIPAGLQQQLRDRILFEDAHFLILDKPPGLAVHSGSEIAYGVIDVLQTLYEDENISLVHRLDRATSGCLLLAKQRQSLLALQTLFKQGQIDKRYRALLVGHWPTDKIGAHWVEQPLRKHTSATGHLVKVDPEGKSARSGFRLLEQFADRCLVEVELDTGRTHQIRVHAAHLGLPVVGDDKYGDRQANTALKQQGLKRLCLHAYRLAFKHPATGQAVRITAEFDF